MAKITFNRRGGQVKRIVKRDRPGNVKPVEDIVREMKQNIKRPWDQEYRDRSLALHGLVCARCGKEFDHTNRHLLTVHHKDGNHNNNPPDGSNWENLCGYCHEDVHSRETLGDFLNGTEGKETSLVYEDNKSENDFDTLGARLRGILKKEK